MTVGERIRETRLKKGVTQEQLGKLCGIAKQTIYKYEKGIITNIPVENVQTIATVLGVSAASLMGWEDSPEDTHQSTKSSLQAAFWGGDKDLSQEDMDAMWSDVERFAAFLAEQKKKEKGENEK